MTQVIDERVVEMKFDNKDFEKNVAQSMSTLDKLKEALNIDSAKSLQNITAASNRVDFSNIGNAIETVKAEFSALQVVGITALAEITKAAINLGTNLVSKVVNPIKTGGMNRALNIEQAKFQLKGLGVAWKDIEDDINYGVRDTAYGLDAAAKAASQLVASGVTLGDNMKASLRGISGVAAMTNSSYEEISSIFTTVAGQGKLMTMQLRQLESRGLNAAATLAQAFGTTEEEIRDMVTKGKIDFEMFSLAMDDAFGAHAKEANETFTGAMSNVRAALSRIGANFATPYMENMRLIAVESIKVINQVNKYLNPIYTDVSNIMETVRKGVTSFLQSSNLLNSAHSAVVSIRNTFKYILSIIDPIKEAFFDIFPKREVGETLRSITLSIERFTRSLSLSEESAENIKRTFRGLFALLDMIGMAFKAAALAMKPLFGDLVSIGKDILGFTGDIGDSLVSLRDYVKESNVLGKAFRSIAFVIRASIAIIRDCINNLTKAFVNFKKNKIDTKDFSWLTNIFTRIKASLSNFKGVGDLLKKIFNGIGQVFEDFKPTAHAIGELFSSLIGGVLQGFSNAFGGDDFNAFSAFLNILSSTAASGMMINLSTAFSQLGKSIRTMGGVSPILTAIKTGLVNTFAQVQADLKADVLLRIAKAIAIFAGSLLVLSLINPTKLAGATVAVGALLTMMVVALKALEKKTIQGAGSIVNFQSFVNSMRRGLGELSNSLQLLIKAQTMQMVAAALLEVAFAVGVLALSIKLIGSMKPEEAATGLIAVTVLLGVLYKWMDMFQKKIGPRVKIVTQGAGQLILLATAVRILGSAIKAIGELDTDSYLKGMGAVVVLTAELGLVMGGLQKLSMMKGSKVNAGSGLVFVELAAAVLLIGRAIEQLGSLGEEQLRQGGLAVLAITVALGFFDAAIAKISTMNSNMAGNAFAIVELAASMMLVANAIKSLAGIGFEDLASSVLALGISMVAMGAGLKILADASSAADLVTTAAAILIFSGSLVLIASAISMVGSMDPLAVVGAILALGVAIAGFVVAATLLAPITPVLYAVGGALALFGISILSVGAGLLMLTMALKVFEGLSDGVIVKFFDQLAEALVLFASNALFIAPAIPILIGIGAALAVIGAAGIVCGAALMVISVALQTIATLGTAGAVALELIAIGLKDLAEAIVKFGASIGDLSMALISSIGNFGLFAVAILTTVAGVVGLIATLYLAIVPMTIFGAVTAAAAVSLTALATAIALFFAAVGEGVPIFKKFSDGIDTMIESIKETFLKGIELIIEAVTGKIGSMVQLGKDLLGGFLEGIQDIPILGSIVSAASNVAQKAIDAIADTQDSHSNSKVGIELGKYLDGGYAQGITDNSSLASDAAGDMTEEALAKLGGQDTAFEAAGESSASSYTDGWRNMFPEFASVCQDYKDEASDTADSVEWDLHRTTEAAKKQAEIEKRMRNQPKKNAEIRARLESKGVIELETDAIEENTEAEIENAKATGGSSKAKSEKKNILESLADTLENQMDIFNKMELKTDITSTQMLENMKSNLDGFASWSARLAGLAERGISKALWEKLAQMGPKGYAELNAFVNMTDEQLQQANEMYAASLAMDDAVIAQIGPSYQKLGGEIPKGIAEGIKKFTSQATEAIDATSEAVEEEFKEKNEIHSPSELYKRIGIMLLQGLRLGLMDNATLIFLEDTIKNVVCNLWVIQPFENSLIESKVFVDIGKNVINGLTEGIMDEEVQRALDEAIETTAAKIETISMAKLKEKSPSKVMQKVGKYASLGLAIGIASAGKNVIDATNMVVDGAIDSYNNINAMNNLIDTSIDFNPVITPLLDLSYIRSQIEELDSMFGSETIGVKGQNGGSPITAQPSEINFTQNNYSPKALSRMEIYRQTKNQLSMMKGVVMANA